MKAELFIEMNCELGECPVWDGKNQRLYWVDIVNHRLYYKDMRTNEVDYVGFHDKVGNAILMNDDKVLVAIGDAMYVYDLEARSLAVLKGTHLNNPMIRYNDGKCDSTGRVLIGTIHLEERLHQEHLYKMSDSGELTSVIDGVSISNGLCWNDDKNAFYFIDTPTKEIWGYEYDLETGSLSNKVVIGKLDDSEGWPDGMTIDQRGFLWVAHWGGKKISIWNPQLKKKVGEVAIPAVNVSSCTFGGQNMDELFITTARVGVEASELDKYPLTGSVFRIKTDVKGLEPARFKA